MTVRILLLLCFSVAALHAAEPLRTQSNVPGEMVFTAQRPHADPFNDVTLDVVEWRCNAPAHGHDRGLLLSQK